MISLVSTYVVCARLSVMHEPAGVVEILVQILQNTLFWNTVSEYPPPPRKWKLSEILALWLFSFRIPPFPPPPENWNLGRSWHFKTSVSESPPNWNLGRSWHFKTSVSEYPPSPPKIEIWADLGTLRLQFQNTPPPNENCQRSWHFDFSVSEYPPSPENWN